LFKVKRGKKEEYIKDEGSMIRYLMRQATGDMSVKPAERDSRSKDATSRDPWKRWLILNVTARERRGGSAVTRNYSISCWRSLSGRKGVLRKEGLTLRKVFQDADLMAKIEGALDKAGLQNRVNVR
jgi:hypothetical protein